MFFLLRSAFELRTSNFLLEAGMKSLTVCLTLLATTALAQTPANLVVENIPTFPEALVEKVHPYLESRTASFQGWNPARAEMLITTRFGNTPAAPREDAGRCAPAADLFLRPRAG